MLVLIRKIWDSLFHDEGELTPEQQEELIQKAVFMSGLPEAEVRAAFAKARAP